MTISLTPSTENLLREKAEREGRDLNMVVDSLLLAALEWDIQDQAEAGEGIRRGDQAAAKGRERPLAAFLAEQQTKHGFSSTWLHDSEASEHLGDETRNAA